MNLVCIICLSIFIIFSCGHVPTSANFATDSSIELQFVSFKNTFNKSYENHLSEERRFRIFRANLMKIQTLNEAEKGSAIYGVTQFTDYSKNEFRKYFLGLRVPQQEYLKQNTARMPKYYDTDLPSNYDWRAYNAVTPIKNQGMCGSCWAFSVTGNIEGQYAIKYKSLLSFSEQELVDCDKTDNGCGGGYMTDAYKAIEKLGGLETESDYPYEGHNDQCHLVKPKIKVRVSSYQNITANETEMAYWLYNNGPISIGLNAFAMQFYFGGISHPPKFLCNPADIDHGVLLAGFGIQRTKFTRKMQPYWLIKNSWGTFWGERGYYKLYRGSGACGVDQMASSAVIE